MKKLSPITLFGFIGFIDLLCSGVLRLHDYYQLTSINFRYLLSLYSQKFKFRLFSEEVKEMKKIGMILIAILFLVPLVLAIKPDFRQTEEVGTKRMIAKTTSPLDKAVMRMMGCEITHELSDSTAIRCPKSVNIENAVEDSIYYVVDITSNAQINADDVWALGYTGKGVTVAVLDTGVDLDHPELIDDIVGGKSFVSYTTSYDDDAGHGTHVSGIISAGGVNPSAKGSAPDAGIWMAKVCDSGGSCYLSDIMAAIEYVVNNKIANIMSISLGGGGTTAGNCDSDSLAAKVNWAVANGVTSIVAAGNSRRYVSSPGCASGAIAVGAVDRYDVRPSWSGSGAALDIVAPGVSIYSSVAGGSYDYYSGTSMAAPHISAVVALLKQAKSTLTDSEIKGALYNTAVDLGSLGWDKYYGHGRVDALAAVESIIPEGPECYEGVDCYDIIICTIDACVDGLCVHTPDDSVCGTDGWFDNGTRWIEDTQCTEKEQTIEEYRHFICDPVSDCRYDVTEIRYTDTVNIRNKANGVSCEDGQFCTVGDGCYSGVCESGSLKSCSDSNVCTVDSCNEVADSCLNTPITQCVGGDGCCPSGCDYNTDSDCPEEELCWSGSNAYLYRNSVNLKKFCKCASGTYGYRNYKYTFTKNPSYKYVDTGNNENWAVSFVEKLYITTYQVVCPDGKTYLTNQNHYY